MYLVRSLRTFIGTNAERTLTPLESFLAGDEFIETDTSNKYLHDGMAWRLEPAGVPGGNDTQVQFNDGGVFEGDSGLVFDKTTKVLTIGGGITVEDLLDVQPTGIVFNDGEGDRDLRIAGNGVTNGYFYDAGLNRHGLGTGTPGATLHVLTDSGTIAIFEENAAGEVGMNSMYNPNTTDSNGALIRFDTDTTGTGAAARSQIAQFGVVFSTHNHATRTGNFVFRNYQSGSFGTRVTIGAGSQFGSPSGGDPGAGAISLDTHINLDEMSSTPSSPTAGTMCNIYMKADKLVIQYNQGGTVRYKYLDLTGTGVTWTHTTTAP